MVGWSSKEHVITYSQNLHDLTCMAFLETRINKRREEYTKSYDSSPGPSHSPCYIARGGTELEVLNKVFEMNANPILAGSTPSTTFPKL